MNFLFVPRHFPAGRRLCTLADLADASGDTAPELVNFAALSKPGDYVDTVNGMFMRLGQGFPAPSAAAPPPEAPEMPGA